ncbi:MAG: ATP-binding protein [Actinomycetota bacterium]
MARQTEELPLPPPPDLAQEPASLSLASIDRRRSQLWAISIFTVVLVAVTVSVFAAARQFLADALNLDELPPYAVPALVVALAITFLALVMERERHLRRLTQMLIDERVLRAALSNRLADISAFAEVGKALNTTLDVNDVLELILSSALKLLGGEEGSIMLPSNDGKTLEVVSVVGLRARQILGAKQSITDGVAGKVAMTQRPLLVQRGDEIESRAAAEGSGQAIFSAISVPLTRQGELVGVLNLNELRGNKAFRPEDLTALELFAEHAAIAIVNARIFERERDMISRLEQVDQVKSQLVSAVSHEFRTPLAVILATAKRITRRSDVSLEESIKSMETIERQGNRLLYLVEGVLTSARIEAGVELEREVVDVRDVAEAVIADLQETSIGQGRQMQIRSETEHPRFWGSVTALHHILLNLVENALKYSEPGTPVTIAVQELPSEILIDVIDRGPGIAEDRLREMFEPFTRLAGAPGAPPRSGFGLGLSIVKSLVDELHGKLQVESEVDVGSVFHVRLPRDEWGDGTHRHEAVRDQTEATPRPVQASQPVQSPQPARSPQAVQSPQAPPT